jgi:hypothetical protein
MKIDMENDFFVKQEAEDFQAEYEIHFVNEQEPEIDEDYSSELRELDDLFAKRLEELQELDEKNRSSYMPCRQVGLYHCCSQWFIDRVARCLLGW